MENPFEDANTTKFILGQIKSLNSALAFLSFFGILLSGLSWRLEYDDKID